MTDLLSYCCALPSLAPLVAFDVVGGHWSMCKKHQAVGALWQVGGDVVGGSAAREYALHLLRICGGCGSIAGGAAGEGPPGWRGGVPSLCMLGTKVEHSHDKGGGTY